MLLDELRLSFCQDAEPVIGLLFSSCSCDICSISLVLMVSAASSADIFGHVLSYHAPRNQGFWHLEKGFRRRLIVDAGTIVAADLFEGSLGGLRSRLQMAGVAPNVSASVYCVVES